MKKQALVLLLTVFLLPLLAHSFGATKVINAIRALPPRYQCPLTLRFTADITTDGPCTVKYKWVRSDGAPQPEIFLRFERAETKTITYNWTLPVYNPVPLIQRTQVEILSPNHLLSNWAGASVTCRPR